jgi:hypothetical protein
MPAPAPSRTSSGRASGGCREDLARRGGSEGHLAWESIDCTTRFPVRRLRGRQRVFAGEIREVGEIREALQLPQVTVGIDHPQVGWTCGAGRRLRRRHFGAEACVALLLHGWRHEWRNVPARPAQRFSGQITPCPSKLFQILHLPDDAFTSIAVSFSSSCRWTWLMRARRRDADSAPWAARPCVAHRRRNRTHEFLDDLRAGGTRTITIGVARDRGWAAS